jgi:hypothetical protein
MARPVSRPCGTRSAYKRHLRKSETPCDLCRLSNNEWHKANNKKKR